MCIAYVFTAVVVCPSVCPSVTSRLLYRNHWIYASHRCGLLLQMSRVPWSAGFGTTASCAKTDEPTEMRFGGGEVDSCGARELRIGWGYTLTPPANEHDGSIHAQRRCGLISDYCVGLLWLTAARQEPMIIVKRP